MRKTNKISSIMHDGVETQEIVEASAEHDFQEMRLNEMIRASGCLSYWFCVYCQYPRKQRTVVLQIPIVTF